MGDLGPEGSSLGALFVKFLEITVELLFVADISKDFLLFLDKSGDNIVLARL